MKPASRILLALLFPGAPPALAANLCAPLTELHEQINFCQENYHYADTAEPCLARLHALVNQKSAEAQRALQAIAASAGASQKNDLGHSGQSYADAQATLTFLLNNARQLRSELQAYADDFVPPVQDSSQVFDLGDPATQAEFRSAPCYGFDMKRMDVALTDLDKVVRDLENTVAKTTKLRTGTDRRDANLDSSHGGRALAGLVPQGQSAPERSDVTGVKREANLAAGQTEREARLARPAENGASSITGRTLVPAGGARSERDLVAPGEQLRAFGNALAKPLSASGQPLAREGKEAESVGAAFWQNEAGEKDLVISAALSAPRAASPGELPLAAGVGAALYRSGARTLASVSADSAATGELSVLANAEAEADASLFQLVHRRYQKIFSAR